MVVEDEVETLTDLLDAVSVVRLQHNTITTSPARPNPTQHRSRRPSFSFAEDMGAATPLPSQYVLIDSARLPAVHPRPRPHISTSIESINSVASTGTIKRTGSHSASSSASSANVLRSLLRGDDAQPKPPPSAFTGPAGAGAGSGTGTSTGPGIDLGVGARPLEIDLKSLHLHLATRVAETVACAEAMWDWVCREQARAAAAAAEADTSTPAPTRRAIERPADPQLAAIRTLTRADFDACVTRFEMYVFLSFGFPSFLHLKFNIIGP